ncbi:MAG: hypothetical protein ACQESR_25115 [Planctomycetota bacterium]
MRYYVAILLIVAGPMASDVFAQDPPAINPFGGGQSVPEDAIPGYVELSDDTILPGHIYLTRDKRLKVADRKLERQREIPLRKIKQVRCRVEKEWRQKQWRFRGSANSEKVYTGQSYPARIYVHTVTLTDGREIEGDLAGVIYLERAGREKKKFVLHKRDKGPVGADFESLVYVRRVKLGPDALEEAKKRLRKQEDSLQNEVDKR